MTDRSEKPDFVVDSSGTVRDVRQPRFATRPQLQSGPRGNGGNGRSGNRSPKKSTTAPYFIPIPIGLICWLVIALIRGCSSPGNGGGYPVATNPILPPSLGDHSDFGRATRAYFRGDYEMAIMYFSAALGSYADVSEVYNRRALAYEAKEEHDKALQDYEQSLSHDPSSAMVHNNRAITYLAMDDYNKAMADLDKAIELEPDLGKAYYNRGLIKSSLGDYDEAIVDLSHALLCPAPEPSSPSCLTLAQMPTGAFSETLEAGQAECEFLEKGADMPSVLYQRALAHEARGDPNSALADLDQAIELLSDRLAKTTVVLRGREPTPQGKTMPAPKEEDGPENARADLASVYYLRAVVHVEQVEHDLAAADLDKALRSGLDPAVGQELKALLTALGAGDSEDE